MEESYKKYSELLLKRCLSIKKGQPLLVYVPIDAIDFVRILNKTALELGVSDIKFHFIDEQMKYDAIKNTNKEDLINNYLFNNSDFDEYAKKNAAILMLHVENPDVFNELDSDKITEVGRLFNSTRPYFRDKQLKYEIPWCIAIVSTPSYAKKVLPNSNNANKEMWDLIFKMCLIDKKDPIKEWNDKIKLNQERVNKLNDLKIRVLKYKNSLGTDFTIGLKNNRWCGASSKTANGDDIIVNMPTEEIFTSPDKYATNGIVYSSSPLVYNGALINEFWIKFKDGKVIDYDATVGKDILKSIIESKNGNYLGEVALVDKNSTLYKSNTIFYRTLYDENAKSHLALGTGFLKCANENMPDWLNISDIHVDFMIGTDDMCVEAETDKGKVLIMKNGKFVI